LKRKGIRKDAKELAENVFEQIQFIRIKSNLLKYHINGVPMRKVVKHLKNMYDKGIILPNGKVKPHELYEP